MDGLQRGIKIVAFDLRVILSTTTYQSGVDQNEPGGNHEVRSDGFCFNRIVLVKAMAKTTFKVQRPF